MRNKRLDVLRCFAVLLVMCHHSGPHFTGIIPLFNKFAWSGVDLFFVLSGFLISGLLFAEYKKHRVVGVKRFLIRRGFKIYPSFYVFLIAAGVAAHFFANNMPTTATEYLHEASFVQNYSSFVWGHTWSLAVEEHFYILLPIFLLLLTYYSKDRENPFKLIPIAWGVVAIFSVTSRALYLRVPQPNAYLGLSYRATNSRIDALFFGVLLGYIFHFYPVELATFVRRHRIGVGIFSFATLSIVLFMPRETSAFVIFGYTSMYLGFGALLLLTLFGGLKSLNFGEPARAIGGSMAFLGTYSYSIYLWHVPVSMWTLAIARRAFHVSLSPWPAFAVYLLASCALGIFMARLVEFPALHLRERWFPSAMTAKT
jgi:peptidoglycan/LPS O-acetylase OafA/YrhL